MLRRWFVFVLACAPAGVQAITIVNPLPANYDLSDTGADGDTVTLNPVLPVYLPTNILPGSPQSRMVGQLQAEFPGWNFVQQILPLSGTLTIDKLDAQIFAPHHGGLDIEARYTRGALDPALGSLHFAQLIDTNVPLGGAGNPYIDPRPNDDMAPFYWTFTPPLIEHMQHETGGNNAFGAFDMEFLDEPSRMCRMHPDSITWRGDLFLTQLVNYNIQAQTGTVHVYDGIRYGFDFVCVPEPATGTILLLSIGVFWRRRSTA
jgi:hypothetical protein